jgi:hypothetical protein
MKTVLLSRDLIFISRVKEVSASHGESASVAKSEEALVNALQSLQEGQQGVLLVDLEKSPFAAEVLAKVIGSLDTKRWRCIGFYSHVHKQTAEHAKALGIQEVVPRSKFVQILPQLYAV